MATTKEKKSSLIQKFRRGELDTGSSEVQIALLTERINDLTEHFKVHKQDFHGRRGLITLVNRRRKLLSYIKSKNPETYTQLLEGLNIRK